MDEGHHPWDCYIYLRGWLILKVNVGTVKYTIHGWYGLRKPAFCWNKLLGDIQKKKSMCRIVQAKIYFVKKIHGHTCPKRLIQDLGIRPEVM